MNYKIKEEKIVYNGHYKIKKAEIVHETFAGANVKVTRECFERGDSAAAVLFEKDSASLLFVRQFRYPTVRSGSGWITELVAGSQDTEGEGPEACILREIREEVGYHVASAEKIGEFFTSPGGSSERVQLFFAETSSNDRNTSGGGLPSENEDIELVRISLDRAKAMLESGRFRDAKTLIGLQWFFLHQTKTDATEQD